MFCFFLKHVEARCKKQSNPIKSHQIPSNHHISSHIISYHIITYPHYKIRDCCFCSWSCWGCFYSAFARLCLVGSFWSSGIFDSWWRLRTGGGRASGRDETAQAPCQSHFTLHVVSCSIPSLLGFVHSDLCGRTLQWRCFISHHADCCFLLFQPMQCLRHVFLFHFAINSQPMCQSTTSIHINVPNAMSFCPEEAMQRCQKENQQKVVLQ